MNDIELSEDLFRESKRLHKLAESAERRGRWRPAIDMTLASEHLAKAADLLLDRNKIIEDLRTDASGLRLLVGGPIKPGSHKARRRILAKANAFDRDAAALEQALEDDTRVTLPIQTRDTE